MTLEVIGTGFGRTGTDSMRAALDLLGFGPCHHMVEVLDNPEQKRLWRALGAGAVPDWTQLLAGYRACVDFPSAVYWRELIAAFPEARVLLTWRSAESWWTSYAGSIGPIIAQGNDPDSIGERVLANRLFGGRPLDREHVIGVYEAHVAEVRATVPPERLLVHAPADGWGPLCAHLGVPVPDVPYPRRNSAAEFQAAVVQRRLEGGGSAAPKD